MAKKKTQGNHGGFMKYVAVITKEDDRYSKEEKQLGYWADCPWDGLLVDIVWGNTYEELTKYGEYEGLFYYAYSTIDGRRLGAGVLDDHLYDEIETCEEFIKGCRLKPDRWYGAKARKGKYAAVLFSARPHACGDVTAWATDEELEKCPWKGLFEDVIYGDKPEDFDFGDINGYCYQLFDTKTGVCFSVGRGGASLCQAVKTGSQKTMEDPVQITICNAAAYDVNVQFWSNRSWELWNPYDKKDLTAEELPDPLKKAYEKLSPLAAGIYLTSSAKSGTIVYYISLITEYSEDEAEALGVTMDELFYIAELNAEQMLKDDAFRGTQAFMRRDHDDVGYHELNILFSPGKDISKALDILHDSAHDF